VVGVLLLEPLHFGFITQPTKRCLSLQFIPEAIAVEDVTEFFRAAAFELSAPCGFHFWFGPNPKRCYLKLKMRLRYPIRSVPLKISDYYSTSTVIPVRNKTPTKKYRSLTLHFAIGVLILLWWVVWTVIRCVKGLLALNMGRDPDSWWFGD
jgi:hypothetical protein